MKITDHWPLDQKTSSLDYHEHKNLHQWAQMVQMEEALLIQLCEHSALETANERKRKIRFEFPAETSLLDSIIVRRHRISFILYYSIWFAGNPQDCTEIQEYLQGIETVRTQFQELLDFSWKSKFVEKRNLPLTLDAFTKPLATKDAFDRTTSAMRGVLMAAFQSFLEGGRFYRQPATNRTHR